MRVILATTTNPWPRASVRIFSAWKLDIVQGPCSFFVHRLLVFMTENVDLDCHFVQM